jgi:nicotinamidase-related amidase
MVLAKKIIAPTLLGPKNHALLLVDPQRLKLSSVRSHDTTAVANGLALLVKCARLFGIDTLVTTTSAARDALVKEIHEALPDEAPVDRTALNAFEDERIVSWAERVGKEKLVMAGLWTESCVAMPALSALSAGYEVYVVTDACGSFTRESHEMGVQRMLQTGAIPISAAGYITELQRDWSRGDTAERAMAIYREHGGNPLLCDRELTRVG